VQYISSCSYTNSIISSFQEMPIRDTGSLQDNYNIVHWHRHHIHSRFLLWAGIYALPANLHSDASMKLSLQSIKIVYVNNGQNFGLNSTKKLNMPTVTLNFRWDSG